MHKPTLEFCTSNTVHGTDLVVEKMAESGEWETDEYGCLGNCGECYMNPFVLVNGETVLADTIEDLQEKIEQELKRQEQQQGDLEKLLDML